MTTYTGTYSPEDNKLRLYASTRLDAETFAKVKAAGFKWAPKQELFVAPMWTPHRNDVLTALCGEIGDEDTSLAQRAEERAERFDNYAEKRTADAERASAGVDAITRHIPFGQPILVGHHSEKRARKDAERIETGLRKAVKMWDTASYWESRAAGAIHAAKYKEAPAVRARRIRTIEADQRKHQRDYDQCDKFGKAWTLCSNEPDAAKKAAIAERIANQSGAYFSFSLAKYPRDLPASQYEGPMGLWSALTGGVITPEQACALAIPHYARCTAYSARWIEHTTRRLIYERAMLADAGGTAADKVKPEKGGACKCWASPRGGWSYIVRVNKVSVSVLHSWNETSKPHSITIPLEKLPALMSREEVEAARADGRLREAGPKGFHMHTAEAPEAPEAPRTVTPAEPDKAEAARQALKAGVQITVAPQLFATSDEVADQMAELIDNTNPARVLEPSAGTGQLLKALERHHPAALITAVEINGQLATHLAAAHPQAVIIEDDFLAHDDLGKFDAVLMNPPFKNGEDIKHIKHAAAMLKPNGLLVALCANGPRQANQLKPLADTWEPLPAGSFKDQGTAVSVVLLTIRAPAATTKTQSDLFALA